MTHFIQATEIQSFVQNNPTVGFALILQLTGVNGSHQFDKLTKTKTVESILALMDTDGIKNYIDYLLRQLEEDKDAEKYVYYSPCAVVSLPLTYIERPDMQTVNARRTWVIDQLSALIRNGGIPKSDDWVQSILDWLVVNGLVVIKKKDERSQFRAVYKIVLPSHNSLTFCCLSSSDLSQALLFRISCASTAPLDFLVVLPT